MKNHLVVIGSLERHPLLGTIKYIIGDGRTQIICELKTNHTHDLPDLNLTLSLSLRQCYNLLCHDLSNLERNVSKLICQITNIYSKIWLLQTLRFFFKFLYKKLTYTKGLSLLLSFYLCIKSVTLGISNLV